MYAVAPPYNTLPNHFTVIETLGQNCLEAWVLPQRLSVTNISAVLLDGCAKGINPPAALTSYTPMHSLKNVIDFAICWKLAYISVKHNVEYLLGKGRARELYEHKLLWWQWSGQQHSAAKATVTAASQTGAAWHGGEGLHAASVGLTQGCCCTGTRQCHRKQLTARTETRRRQHTWQSWWCRRERKAGQRCSRAEQDY